MIKTGNHILDKKPRVLLTLNQTIFLSLRSTSPMEYKRPKKLRQKQWRAFKRIYQKLKWKLKFFRLSERRLKFYIYRPTERRNLWLSYFPIYLLIWSLIFNRDTPETVITIPGGWWGNAAFTRYDTYLLHGIGCNQRFVSTQTDCKTRINYIQPLLPTPQSFSITYRYRKSNETRNFNRWPLGCRMHWAHNITKVSSSPIRWGRSGTSVTPEGEWEWLTKKQMLSFGLSMCVALL